jgi:LmbE family N-acetylglucosaminyl deacetylase
MNTVLFFSPHFDDESIACGGTIIRHVKQGDDVSMVFMTSGNSGSVSHPELNEEEYAQLRRIEAAAAIKVLGITRQFECLEQDEGFMYSTPVLEKQLVAMMRSMKPDIVYVPHENEVHNDHIVTNRVVVKAVQRASWRYLPSLGMNPHKVSEIRAYEIGMPLQNPNFYVDITHVLSLKQRAIECYQSQLVHHKYQQAIIGLNNYRGLMGANVDFAEAFRVEYPLTIIGPEM